MMFHFITPFTTQVIKTQAVARGVVGFQQFVFQYDPLVRRDITFKY